MRGVRALGTAVADVVTAVATVRRGSRGVPAAADGVAKASSVALRFSTGWWIGDAVGGAGVRHGLPSARDGEDSGEPPEPLA